MATFNEQVSRLHAIRQNNEWQRSTGGAGGFVSRGAPVLGNIRNYGFNDFAKTAYGSRRGVAVRENPLTGEREMFVAGTRTGGDWGANLRESARRKAETVLHLKPHPVKYRTRYENYLSDIARQNKVDVIYGHSRGAALVNDIPNYRGKRIGLDGATIMAFDDYNLDNYRQKQVFDRVIGGKYRVFGKHRQVYESGSPYPIIRNRGAYGYKKYLPVVNDKYHYIYRDY